MSAWALACVGDYEGIRPFLFFFFANEEDGRHYVKSSGSGLPWGGRGLRAEVVRRKRKPSPHSLPPSLPSKVAALGYCVWSRGAGVPGGIGLRRVVGTNSEGVGGGSVRCGTVWALLWVEG